MVCRACKSDTLFVVHIVHSTYRDTAWLSRKVSSGMSACPSRECEIDIICWRWFPKPNYDQLQHFLGCLFRLSINNSQTSIFPVMPPSPAGSGTDANMSLIVNCRVPRTSWRHFLLSSLAHLFLPNRFLCLVPSLWATYHSVRGKRSWSHSSRLGSLVSWLPLYILMCTHPGRAILYSTSHGIYSNTSLLSGSSSPRNIYIGFTSSLFTLWITIALRVSSPPINKFCSKAQLLCLGDHLILKTPSKLALWMY